MEIVISRFEPTRFCVSFDNVRFMHIVMADGEMIQFLVVVCFFLHRNKSTY